MSFPAPATILSCPVSSVSPPTIESSPAPVTRVSGPEWPLKVLLPRVSSIVNPTTLVRSVFVWNAMIVSLPSVLPINLSLVVPNWIKSLPVPSSKKLTLLVLVLPIRLSSPAPPIRVIWGTTEVPVWDASIVSLPPPPSPLLNILLRKSLPLPPIIVSVEDPPNKVSSPAPPSNKFRPEELVPIEMESSPSPPIKVSFAPWPKRVSFPASPSRRFLLLVSDGASPPRIESLPSPPNRVDLSVCEALELLTMSLPSSPLT